VIKGSAKSSLGELPGREGREGKRVIRVKGPGGKVRGGEVLKTKPISSIKRKGPGESQQPAMSLKRTRRRTIEFGWVIPTIRKGKARARKADRNWSRMW